LAALRELRDKPARTIRVTATMAKILLNDPGVKMRCRWMIASRHGAWQ
jgi:hypothetical protein